LLTVIFGVSAYLRPHKSAIFIYIENNIFIAKGGDLFDEKECVAGIGGGFTAMLCHGSSGE